MVYIDLDKPTECGGCDHTTDIKHAAHFKNVAGQYFERLYMEEEDDGNL